MDKFDVKDNREEHWDYLNDLQDSGDTNMYGAASYIQREFDLTKDNSYAVLTDWMDNYIPH
jgi:hypothetical protein